MFGVLGKTIDRVQAAVTGDDACRLAARREIRRQLAERDSIAAKLRIVNERIAALDRDADAAAQTHSEVCSPVQHELAAVEESIIAATADRQPLPKNAEARRRELIDLIENQNQVLSAAVERCNLHRNRLLKQQRELGVEAAQFAHLPNKLASQELGNPRLLLAEFVAASASKFAHARLRAAEQSANATVALIEQAKREKNKDNEAIYTRRLERWQAEVEDARRVYQEANQTAEAAHSAVVNE